MNCRNCDIKLDWELEVGKDNDVYQKAYCCECGIFYYRDLEIIDNRKKNKNEFSNK